MMRKHIKIEPKRWYYHCDTIEMLIWQDQPSGGAFPFKHFNHNQYIKDNEYKKFNRDNKKGRKNFVRDLERTIDQYIIFQVFQLGYHLMKDGVNLIQLKFQK